jgi:hypothetical protein
MDIEAQKHRAFIWLGELFFTMGETDSAVSCLERSLQWYEENGFLLWALYSSNWLANFNLLSDDLTNAGKHYQESEGFFNEMLSRKSYYRYDSLKYTVTYGLELYHPQPLVTLREQMWNWGAWTYYGLYRIYEKENRTKEALKYHILFSNAGDSLNKIQQQRETTEMQTRYETEQKEIQIENLSQENASQSFKLRQSRIFLFGLAGFVILVILFAIVLIRQGRLRERQNNIILQQKLFRSQMNPHFIFNSLSSIHHFMIYEEPAKAASYLSRFSRLIRAILHSSVEEYISLGNEISTIENYLELQKVRFPDKFEFKIEVDDQLDIENTLIPSMITQPFVENAIEHGIKQKTSKGNIQVRYLQKGEMLVIEVEDDGIGRSKAKELSLVKNKDHTSLATSIIRERIRSLNRALKKKIRLDILDLKNEKGEAAGTKVILEVPLSC